MSGPTLIFTVMLLFCRIGACLMIAPGLGNTQIPAQIRLFVALAVTLALAPALVGLAKVVDLSAITMVRLVVFELLIGGLIGAIARLFFSALESLAFAAATMLGLANPFGFEMEQNQALPPLATLVALGATALIFVGDFHWQIIIALLDSYAALPFGGAFEARRSLADIGGVLGQSFLIAVRVASPFFLYSVVVNFAFALINRVTPAVAIFFIAPPFIAAGGLVMLYFSIRGQIGEFMAAFSKGLGGG